MNTPTLLSEAELTTLGVKAFQGLGLTQQDAQDVCRVLVMADLFGLSTHGMSRVESYGERLLVKGINPRPNITVERVAPALVKVDGDNGVGPVVGMRSLQAAMDVARECGIGMALARGSNHGSGSPKQSLRSRRHGRAQLHRRGRDNTRSAPKDGQKLAGARPLHGCSGGTPCARKHQAP